MTEFATRAVHAGLDPDPTYGSVVPAIHQSSTYVQPRPGQFVEDYDYSRAANPTRRALENALGELEGGHATAFASGMAATHALLTAVTSAGDHVIIPDDLYGGTYRLVDKVLARFGVAYDMVDQTDLDAVRARAAPGDQARSGSRRRPTRRSRWSTSLAVIDAVGPGRARRRRQHVRHAGQPAPARVRRRRGRALHDQVPRRPLRHGRRRGDRRGSGAARGASASLQLSIGAVPGPLDCFLVHRGLRTLHLRMAAHAENGRAVSEFLREQPGVSDVRWPGFAGMVCFRHPARGRDRRARRSCSRSPSRSAAWSRWSRSRRR